MSSALVTPGSRSLRQKFEVARALKQLLEYWEIPSVGCLNTQYHYVFQVSRFHLWAYWRPMTVARYEQLTFDYRGPYLPIFASRNEYVEDERMVYEGFDFAMTRNHRYRRVPFYFVIPSFLLSRPWPSEREWRWHPAVKVTKAVLHELLQLEVENGGWRRNHRNRLQIPKVTGCSGKDTRIQKGAGWATLGFQNHLLTTEEQQELFDAWQDHH